jgi:transposase
VLDRLALRLRHGRPQQFSPDPDSLRTAATLHAWLAAAALSPVPTMVRFVDELTDSHWPLLGRDWGPATGPPPCAARAVPGERRHRVVGARAALTGRVLTHHERAIGKDVCARFLHHVAAAYPQAARSAVVLDNWPVPHSPLVRAAAAALPRIRLVFRPTYAPWLNPIEQLWGWLKTDVLHLHRLAGHWADVRAAVVAFRDRFAVPSPELLARVGLLGSAALAMTLHPITDLGRQT